MTCEKHTTRYIHPSATTHIYTNNEINVQNETTSGVAEGWGMRQFAWGWSHGSGRCNNNSKASIIGKYNHMVQGVPQPLYIFTLCFYFNTMVHELPTCPVPFVL